MSDRFVKKNPEYIQQKCEKNGVELLQMHNVRG